MPSFRQDVQVRPSTTYDDTLAPGVALQTGAAHLEDDENALRSIASEHLDGQASNWYGGLVAPVTFEGGASRGINPLNQDLHDLERQRVLKRTNNVGLDVAAGAGQAVTLGAGELPANTTIAIGAVTTLGTVVATATTFGTASAADVVAGANALQPKNMVRLVTADAARDPVTDGSGNEVYGLLQSESAVDGSTASDTTPNRLQISFVRVNATSDGLELVPAATLTGVTFDYANVERRALADVPEECWLGDDMGDSGAANVTRQSGYDNQGATPVDLTTNATLDLEGAGLAWAIRDDLEAPLLTVTEGSAGGTSTVALGADVDTFDNNAVANDFASGATLNSGGTRPVAVGVTDGVVESTAGDLELQAAAELAFDDGNRSGSTWAAPLLLTATTAEWDAMESTFGGELSVAAMLVAAAAGNVTKITANVISTTTGGNDLSGPSNDNNLSADLGDLSGGTFAADYDFYFNGGLLPPTGSGGANTPVVSPGTSLANGQIQVNFTVRATPANNPDVFTVIKRA